MRVPTYEQQVRTNALPGVRQNISTTAADFGGTQAATMKQAGADLGRTSDILQAHAMQRAKEDNETAVMDAYTRLSTQERDYLYGENGVLTKTGANALGSTAKTAKDVGSMAEQIAGSLGNDEQRKMFKQMYQRRLDSSLDSIARHEAGERRKYQNSVNEGVAKNAAADAETRWNDPLYIGESSKIAATAMAAKLRKEGVAEELIGFETKAIESSVWKGAIEKAIQYDPFKADDILKSNRDKLSADDAADLEKALKTPLATAKGRAIAAEVFAPSKGGGLPAPVTSLIAQQSMMNGVDPKLAMTIARLENAKGDPNARPIGKDGKPLSSAVGIYQFIDDTWKAAGGTDADRMDMNKQVELGVKHIKQNQDSMREFLGREPTGAEVYLAHQQGLAGAKALLGAEKGTAAAIALAPAYKGNIARAGDAINNNGGRSDMTAEQFVARWNDKYNRQSGRAGIENMSLTDAIEYAKARAGDDPDFQAEAVKQVTEVHKQAKAAKEEQKDALIEQVYQMINQGERDVVSKLTPQQVETLGHKTINELETKARNVKTDWSFYNDYMAMTPAEKAAIPVNTLMTKLGSSELKTAIGERNGAKKGGSKEPWLETRSAILKNYSIEMGVLPEKASNVNDKDKMAYNMLSEYMNHKMGAYREKHGFEMPEDEFRKEAGMALTRVVTEQGRIFDTTKRVFELRGETPMTIKSISDVPTPLRSDIEMRLVQGGYAVNESLVLSIALAKLTNDRARLDAILSGAKKK